MKKGLLFVIVALFPALMFAQDSGSFGIKFSGFVKSDFIFDSRQSVAVREGHFHLYPLNEVLDVNGDDINASPNFNMLSIQSRLKGTITGPNAFGAKTSAVIEGAFFGHTGADINGFRLRHAFAKLKWENTELIAGQYWHAMFITECFPGTVSFNTGAPFQPFSRNPQIRFSHNVQGLKLTFTAMSQRDFASTGPLGGGSMYLRNNIVPELNFTAQYKHKTDGGNEYLIGAGVNYLSLVPRLVTDSGYVTDQNVSGLSFMGFGKIKTEDLTIKVEGVYGQNMTHLTMIGGYAVANITNPANNFVEYTPISTLSVWTDIHTNGKKVQAGLFAGLTKNQGAGKDLMGPIYSRGSNIDKIIRVSPRIIFNSGKMRFAGELEYTQVSYGTTQLDGTVDDAKDVSNLRFVVGVYYFF